MWRPTDASLNSAKCWNGILQDRNGSGGRRKVLGLGVQLLGVVFSVALNLLEEKKKPKTPTFNNVGSH